MTLLRYGFFFYSPAVLAIHIQSFFEVESSGKPYLTFVEGLSSPVGAKCWRVAKPVEFTWF
jgi:hypothetical protein